MVEVATRNDGLALRNKCCQEYADDDGIVRGAVSQNGMALGYASRRLRGCEEIVRRAVAQNPEALKFASWELQVALLDEVDLGPVK